MQRITITVPDEVLAGVHEKVAAGKAPSVSAFMAEAAGEAVRHGDLAAALRDLEKELGPTSAEDRAWAADVVDRAR